MKLHSQLLLALLTVVSFNNVVFADTNEGDREVELRRRKVCRCCSLIVANNGSFGGSVTASSFAVSPLAASTITGAGAGAPGIGGALAWGEVGNEISSTTTPTTVASGNFFPMNYAGPTFSGVNQTATNTSSTVSTDGLTLVNAGVYLIQYQVNAMGANTGAIVELTTGTGSGSLLLHTSEEIVITGADTQQVTGMVLTFQPANTLIRLLNRGGANIVSALTNDSTTPVIFAKIMAIRIA